MRVQLEEDGEFMTLGQLFLQQIRSHSMDTACKGK